MTREEIEDLMNLMGEEFYDSVEEKYGENVTKILRYHDIDEKELIEVFEKPNNENSSDELIALKRELCNFIGDTVLLKVGTKGKTCLLLHFTHGFFRKKARASCERKLGRLDKSKSSSGTADSNSTEFHLSVQRSIKTLLARTKNNVHGIIVPGVSANNFKIDIYRANDDLPPTCFVQCMCGDQISLYYRNSGFQISNIKSFETSMVHDINQESNDNQEFSNGIDLGDGDLEEENTSSLIDNHHSNCGSIDNDNNVLSTAATNKELSHQQQQQQQQQQQ